MKIKLFAATKKKCNTFSFTVNFEISAVTLNQMAIKHKESTIVFYELDCLSRDESLEKMQHF
jgi:hypothetical protein